MTSKDQERKALEEIKAIIERIGGDQSYIGMAFKGCFDIAEQNIINDFGDSWMDRWSAAINENSKLNEEIRELKKHKDSFEAELEIVKDQLNKVRDIRDEWMDEAKSTDARLTEIQQLYQESISRVAQLETENTKLKAKLYDLMTA